MYKQDKNLKELYNYLKANNMYEDFIRLDSKKFKKLLESAKDYKKGTKKGKNNVKKEALERNEK